jgi:hypothetical protein
MKVKPQLVAVFCLPLLALELALPLLVRAMDSEDLYKLCSEFPYNSACKGYEAPVALEKRSGQVAGCVFKTAQVETKGACKINFENDEIKLYHEFGQGLSVLNNQRATQTVKIPTTGVSRIQYRETKKLNTGNAIFNTLAFGLIGLALTKKRTYVEINVSYADPTPAAAASELMMVFDRDGGMAMRNQLEKATGKTAEMPEQK